MSGKVFHAGEAVVFDGQAWVVINVVQGLYLIRPIGEGDEERWIGAQALERAP